MKVGLVAADADAITVLRRVVDDERLEVAWTAASPSAIASSARSGQLALVVHGGLDASTLAPDLVARGLRVVVLVRDPAASVDALYRAIAGGGVEVVTMPRLDPGGAVREGAALSSILARHRRASAPSTTKDAPVLAIAASAGGPEALAEVLGSLAPDLPLRVIVAQHIEPAFVPGLARWLATRTRRRVEIAEEGRALEVETTLVVRSDRQPTVDGRGIVRYRGLDPANPFHPCIDALLASLAAAPLLRGAAALLTGMGSDGAAGLLALRAAGWVTIAQDAASSRVFGMPRAAAELGAASHVVALDHIGATASRALRAAAGARA